MTELRAQVNMRINADMNISISTTTLSDTPDEARDARARGRPTSSRRG